MNIDLIHPVGKVLETSDSTFDPNVRYPGTTWELDDSGTVLVSKADSGTFSGNVESTLGSETAVANLPAHSHISKVFAVMSSKTTYTAGNFVSNSSSREETLRNDSSKACGQGTQNTTEVGSGTAHENRQAFIVVNRWIRRS